MGYPLAVRATIFMSGLFGLRFGIGMYKIAGHLHIKRNNHFIIGLLTPIRQSEDDGDRGAVQSHFGKPNVGNHVPE